MNALVNLGNRLLDASRAFAWLPPLLGRVTVGWAFAVSGWGKLHSLDRVQGFFGSIGIPSPGFMAPFVGTVEFVGGLLLLAGLATRIASIPLVIVMIVAMRTALADKIGDYSGLIGTMEYLYIVLLVWLIVSGPGKVALDALVARKYRG